jgi:hypothetical protein
MRWWRGPLCSRPTLYSMCRPAGMLLHISVKFPMGTLKSSELFVCETLGQLPCRDKQMLEVTQRYFSRFILCPTCGVETAYSSGAPEFTTDCLWGSCCPIFSRKVLIRKHFRSTWVHHRFLIGFVLLDEYSVTFNQTATLCHDMNHTLCDIGSTERYILHVQACWNVATHKCEVPYSDSSLKQQPSERHIAPLGHIILILSNQSLLFLLNALQRSNKYQFYSLWFDPTERYVSPRAVVSVSYHYKNPTQHVGLEQSGPRLYLIEN